MSHMSQKTVYVGMSGGVDSSLTAALLLEAGYKVVGAYMKNWSQDLPGHHCPWLEDYQDAKKVAVQLGIELKLFDFETEYRRFVVDYMVSEYQSGRTPNPDIMCNQEVKFKLFLNAALEAGADLIATGHYARTSGGKLYKGKDSNKDQSYFLYRVNGSALEKTLMPIGEYEKPLVRQMAADRNLATAKKKDSQGICFVGKVGIKEFLLHELGPQRPGPIVQQHGVTIGSHDGALFYTIGQRHGLNVGGGLPYYVTGKDMKTNTVYVTTDLQDERLWRSSLRLKSLHWIAGQAPTDLGSGVTALTRYRSPYVDVTKVEFENDNEIKLELGEQVRAITPGQSVVLYKQDLVLGGGIVWD